MVAPPGYGKTTLLAQWGSEPATGGLALGGPHDNDPAVLLTYLAAALDRVEPIDPDVLLPLPRRARAPGHRRARGWRPRSRR